MLTSLFFVLVLVNFSSSTFNFESAKNNIIEENASGECLLQYNRMDNLTKLQMVDASSKFIIGGIAGGNFADLGYYDECLSIADEKKKIYGKYCLVSIWLKPDTPKEDNLVLEHTLRLAQLTQQKLKDNLKINISAIEAVASRLFGLMKFGICIPDKCGVDVLKSLPVQLNETASYTKFTNNKMDTSAVIAMVVIYFFIVVSIISTVYDIILDYRDIDPKHQILIAFSMLTNGKKLLKSSKTTDQLGCLNGIKSFSMMWVVLGHACLMMLYSGTVDNLLYINDWLDEPQNMFILSATLSVDTFFTVGGLLTVYVYMKAPQMNLQRSFISIPLMYVHRYIRLTPALGMMVLIYGSGLIRYISDGPKWYSINGTIDNCANSWWAALLYIQNYRETLTMCITQSWYLSVDFQLFVVGAFLLIPLKRWPIFTLPVLCVLAVTGWIAPFCVGYTSKSTGVGMGLMTQSVINDYYFATHARFSPYLIGMIAGYLIFYMKSRPRPLTLGTGVTLLLWAVSLGTILLCIFDGFKLTKDADNQWVDGLYMALNRSVWALAVSLLIFLCTLGTGGPINKFLSLPIFEIIAKLSYSMYLVHLIIIEMIQSSSRKSQHFSTFNVIMSFFAYFAITLGVSAFYCLLFESPMITIEKLILPGLTKKRHEKV